MNTVRYKKLLSNHIENGFAFYFSLLLVFVFGIIIGSLMIKFLDVDAQDSILNYTSAYIRNIYKDISANINIFKTSIIIRFVAVAILYLCGMVKFGVLVPFVIFLQGGSLGFNVAYIINNYGLKGSLVSVISFLPQYALYIPSYIILGSLSMTMAMAIKNKMSANKNIIKISRMSGLEYTVFFIVFSFLILLGVIYESYISPIFLNLIT